MARVVRASLVLLCLPAIMLGSVTAVLVTLGTWFFLILGPSALLVALLLVCGLSGAAYSIVDWWPKSARLPFRVLDGVFLAFDAAVGRI